LNIQILQGSAATYLRWGGRFIPAFSAVYLRMRQWKNY